MEGWFPVTSASQYFSFVEAAPLCCCYVTAPWCFRCRQVADKLAGFPGDYDSVRFYSVDLQECEELGDILDIRTLPTFVLLRGGAEAARLEGVPQQRPARALAQAIREHLLSPSGSGQGTQAAGGRDGSAGGGGAKRA